MAERLKIGSEGVWEDIVGYSRAIRVGNIIEVAGTTAMNGDVVVGENNVYEQTQYIFLRIKRALEQAGGRMEDVIRTRMYVTDISQWEEVAKAHGEIFKLIKPVATMVEVQRLIDEKLLIEIEVTAIVA